MKSGTPGFRGKRLVEARDARGVTASELAKSVGVTRGAISQYESGTQTPRPEVMDRIASFLELPLDFFLRDVKEGSKIAYYRSLSAATKTARKKAESRHGWLRDIVTWLGTMVDFPALNFPDFASPEDPGLISDSDIEEAATRARAYWKLGNGPISNVVWHLENNGAIVSLSDFGSEDLDAFSEIAAPDFHPFVSVSSDKKIAARSNFTAAHELGHLLLHKNIPEAVARRQAEHRLIEQQANHFADAFLLPESTFAEQVNRPSLELFRALKPRWRVSIGAMIMRSKSLGLVDEEKFRRLWIAYSARGWKHGEPFDGELADAGPRVLRRAFELLINERVVTREQIRVELPFAPTDIEKLCGLDEGFLNDGFGGNLVRLPTPRHTTTNGGAKVLPFNRA